MPRASSSARALGLLLAAALVAQGSAPTTAWAAPAPAPSATTSSATPGAGTATTTTSTAPGTGAAPQAGPPPPPATPSAEAVAADPPPAGGPPQPALVAPPNNVTPTSSAGIGGRAVAADDPEAKRAKADLEGSALRDDKEALAQVPSRLPPLQRGAWWSMFGAFALASAGGVFAGLAEVQEDRAERLAITLDTETGSQLVYTDVQAEYDDILRTGRRDAAVAKGLLAAGAGFLVGGVVLFIVHAVRARKTAPKGLPQPPRASVGAARGGLEVRF